MSSIDPSEFDSIAIKARAFLNQDPEQRAWFESAKRKLQEENSYPDQSFQHIVDYLSSLNSSDSQELLNQMTCYPSDYEIMILDSIFFDYEDGNDGGENDEYIEHIFSIEEEDENEKIDNELTPAAFFLSIKKNIKESLSLSDGLAYLLLKKFGWDLDQAKLEWEKSQDSILKSLRIKIGSKEVPNLQSALDPMKCDNEECPICHSNRPLLQLYCGHKICKDCLNQEIREKLAENKLPHCHQIYAEDNKECNSEILIKSLNDEQLLQDYKRALLSDRLNNNSISIKGCPKCNWYITPKNMICPTITRCKHCLWPICIKCGHEPHWPVDCQHIQEFNSRHSKMQQLYSAQKKWENRELKLKEVRISQKDDIKKVLEETVTDFINFHKSEVEDIEKQQKNIIDAISQWLKEIEEDKKKLKELVKDQQPIPAFHPYMDHILQLIENIEKEKDENGPLNYDLEQKKNQLNSNIQDIRNDNDIFLNGCSSASNYEANLHNFEQFQNQHAYKMVNIKSDDSELAALLQIQIECPNCGGTPDLIEGVNQMECNCGEKVCLLCGGLWDEEHQIYKACPKYMPKYEIDPNAQSVANDNDNKFYKQPMSMDKRVEFMSYNNFYAIHKKNLGIYNEMVSEYSNTNEPLRCEITKYPPLVRLRRTFEKNMTQEKAKILSLKVLNTALLAQSIVTWGYVQIYFLDDNLNYSKANELELKILKMKKALLELLNKIKDPSKYINPQLEFEIGISTLKNEIEDISK